MDSDNHIPIRTDEKPTHFDRWDALIGAVGVVVSSTMAGVLQSNPSREGQIFRYLFDLIFWGIVVWMGVKGYREVKSRRSRRKDQS